MGVPIRIEPHTGPRPQPDDASDDLARGLANQLYDPLWMLSRQLVTGELVGSDAGTPISVTYRCEVRRVTGWAPERDPNSIRDFDPERDVLEALVEGQPTVWTARLRWAAGREFRALLSEHGVGAADVAQLVEAYPLDPPAPEAAAEDPDGARVRMLAAGRVIDGGQLQADLGDRLRTDPPTLPPTLDLAAPLRVIDAARSWLTWVDALMLEETDEDNAWDDEHHDYRFSITAPAPQNTLRLTAHEHRGGYIDWYTFDAEGQIGFNDAPVEVRRSYALPTPSTFRGMPNPRWWKFEEGTFAPGKVEPQPADLPLLAALNYALVYGNDFYYIPVQLAAGSLCRTTSLLVTDTFGLTVQVKPAATLTEDTGRASRGSSRWTMFTLTKGPGEVADELFVPPITVQPVTSNRLEDSLMMRDEGANIAWAVQRSYEGDSGEVVPRGEREPQPAEQPGRVQPGQPVAGLRYRLGTDVPANWFPMIHEPAHALRITTVAAGGQPQARLRGTLLREGQRVADEEVPREGENLWRERVLARSPNGSAVVWGRTRAETGRGEGSSGLLFDQGIETGPQ